MKQLVFLLKNLLTTGIALDWLINGLFCKALHLVPRHQAIIGRILGAAHSAILTNAIGVSEMLMAVWILTKIKPRLCAIAQIIIIAAMNIIEFVMAPDLLLFGRLNIVVATFLIMLILLNEFIIREPTVNKH